MKKNILLVVALVLVVLSATQMDPSVLMAKAQTSYWQQYCAGEVSMTAVNGGTMVTCSQSLPTATNPAPTATSPAPTATNPAPTATNPAPTATHPAPTAPPSPSGNGILVDHNSLALFEQIPQQYLAAARDLKVLMSDRSVGGNFSEGLGCLVANSFGQSPSFCRKHYDGNIIRLYNQTDMDAGRVPAVISFQPSLTLYDRSNWVYEYKVGSWSELTCNFIQSLAPAHMDKDVLSYQFSYLNVLAGSDIDKFWEDNANLCDIYDLEAFIAQHPEKTFIFWTASLARGIGTQEATDFNNRMRQYARDHGKILFDFAAIESYTQSGQPCYDNRDGVTFTSPTNSTVFENYANDGVQQPAICQDYTTETDGGHLGSSSGGMIRTAKAFWVLMAEVAGWRP